MRSSLHHDQELLKEHIQKPLVFNQITYLDKLIEEALDGEARDNPGKILLTSEQAQQGAFPLAESNFRSLRGI